MSSRYDLHCKIPALQKKWSMKRKKKEELFLSAPRQLQNRGIEGNSDFCISRNTKLTEVIFFAEKHCSLLEQLFIALDRIKTPK